MVILMTAEQIFSLLPYDVMTFANFVT